MPKTILLPSQLVTDKTKCPKVIVLQACESRDANGNLYFASYYFKYNNKHYRVNYLYKHHKCIRSQLFIV